MKEKKKVTTYLTSTTVTDEDKLESGDLLLFSHCELDGLCDVEKVWVEEEKRRKEEGT